MTIDANKLEAMAKERPDECFLKGSGVLKLIDAIRTLERQLSAAQTDTAVQPEPVAIPQGFALVPILPNEAMRKAPWNFTDLAIEPDDAVKIWKVMVAAAPVIQEPAMPVAHTEELRRVRDVRNANTEELLEELASVRDYAQKLERQLSAAPVKISLSEKMEDQKLSVNLGAPCAEPPGVPSMSGREEI